MNRINSNTPLQALVLLNDPNVAEAARVFDTMTSVIVLSAELARAHHS